ncbi:MAG: hypothetical protein Kow0040_16060 [Thermogutta sp.]
MTEESLLILPPPPSTAVVWLYAVLAAVNAAAAFRTARARIQDRSVRGFTLVPVSFGLYAAVAAGAVVLFCFTGRLPGLSQTVKRTIDSALSAAVVCVLWWSVLFAFITLRRALVSPLSRPHALNLPVLAFLVALSDTRLADLVSRPDNFAIVLMVAATLFYLYFALSSAVRNDDRISQGLSPLEGEKREREKVFVWPDLVYIELIAMIVVTVALLIWSLALPAPLEAPADPLHTPNPAKAPWYFVGLQELLVYFDPWLAGVVIPTVLALGLIVLPYLDPSPEGSGYYSLASRPRVAGAFLFGFFGLWLLLIVIGVFFRGPNWAFYGPFESRDLPKIESKRVWPLSTWVHERGQASEQPSNENRQPDAAQILVREWPGLAFLVFYFLVLPYVLQRGPTLAFRHRVGAVRYHLAMFLFLFMFLIPIKILLREILAVNYILYLPEWGWSI